MITIKIKPWSQMGTLVHGSTSYQVATDLGFTNIVDDNPNDTVNLTVYYSLVVVPAGVTYYVRVSRNFTDGTSSGWGNPIAVTSMPSNGGLLTYSPIKVFQPVVTVDRAALNDPLQTTYTVTTSAFSGVNEGHGETLWIVSDDSGNILDFISSKVDLTSIVLTKPANMLSGAKYLEFSAIHRTLSNIESPVGSTVVDITDVNFSISAGNSIHAPGIDIIITVTSTAGLPNNVTSRLELTDVNGSVLWGIGVLPGATTITIPGILFTANSEYTVTAYGTPADANHKYSIPLYISANITGYMVDRSRVYSKVVTSIGGAFPFVGGLDTLEVYDGRILAPLYGTR